MLGDLTGFGISHFDFDSTGYVKTATEVSSGNSALMRNVAQREHLLEGSLAKLSRALLHMGRSFGNELADGGEAPVLFDGPIISDAAAGKAQDMAEVGVTMHAWECRMKWYGEGEKTAKARAHGLGKKESAAEARAN